MIRLASIYFDVKIKHCRVKSILCSVGPVAMSENTRAILYLVVSSLLWGGVFHVIKYPLAVAPPFVLLTARFTLTSVVLLPFLVRRNSYRLVLDRKIFWKVVLLSLVGICGYNIFFTYGMAMSDPATGSLIIAANPVMTTLLAALWKREKISPLRWTGVVVAFLGLAWIVFEGNFENARHLKLGPGNLILLGAPFVWAIYSIESRSVMAHVPATVMTAALVLLSLPPQAAVAVYQLDSWSWAVSTPFWLGVIYLGIFATGVSYLFWNEGVRILGAARGSIFVNLIPVTALLIAFFRGQPLYAHHYIGGLIVVAGVILASRK
jgi:drug/metabolite transporter (DMT)-like permease